MTSLRSVDPKRQAQAALFTAWVEELSTDSAYSTSDLLKQANEAILGTPQRPNFYVALLEIARDRHGSISSTRLGNWLGRNENKEVAGFVWTGFRA
jgi:hypothetical protein